MHTNITRIVSAMFFSIVLCASAAAQSAFSGSKEGSTADAAAKLLQDPNKGGETGLSDSLADTENTQPAPENQKLEGQVLDAIDVPKANPVTILNCSGKSMVVKAYNSNDTVVLIPFQEKTIANGKAASLKCKTKSCRLRAGTGNPTDAMSGYVKLQKGFSKASLSGLQGGC